MTDSEGKHIGYARQKARSVLKEYFLKNPPERLPIPVQEIAKFYGFEIYELKTMNKHQRAIKQDVVSEGRKLIGLNAHYHHHNQRFSIGHELGHHFLGHPPEEDCDEDQIKLFNSEADEFSAELLMPLDILKEKLAELKDIPRIAKAFDVSTQALWIKMSQQKLIGML
jgi:Zn-dependent peptidase ImmA (M78 family)